MTSGVATSGAVVQSRSRVRAVLITVAVVAAATGLLLLFRFNPVEHPFFPRCAFHAVSGWECPGCGGQRALHALLHGDLRGALHCNALLVGLLPLGSWMLFRFLWNHTSRRALGTPFRHHAWAWILCGLVIVFGILRNLPGCEWLRP